jgi:hypothetical protein
MLYHHMTFPYPLVGTFEKSIAPSLPSRRHVRFQGSLKLTIVFVLLSPSKPTRMASAEARQALPFSAAEKALQQAPYIYTSGTVPIAEKDAEYVFYQTWADGRVEQKNVDVAPPSITF